LIFIPQADTETEMSHRANKAAVTTVERHSYTRDQWTQQMAQQHITREDMNRLVMDFLVVEGYMEVARQFSLESGTERASYPLPLHSRRPLLTSGKAQVNLDDIAERMNIRNAIQQGRVQEGIEFVNDLDSEVSLTLPPPSFSFSFFSSCHRRKREKNEQRS